MYLSKKENPVYLASFHEASSSQKIDMPRHIAIEFSNRCNMSCIYCCRKIEYPSPNMRGYMSDEVFQLTKPILTGARSILISGLGEQTLHPKCEEWLAEIRSINPTAWFRIVSNAKKPFTDSFLETLATNEVRLSLSIDSCNKETFNKIRVSTKTPDTFSQVVENLERIKTFKEKHNTHLPYVSIGFVLTEESVDGIVDTLRFLMGYNISGFFYSETTDRATPPDFYNNGRKKIILDENLRKMMLDESERLDIRVENRTDLMSVYDRGPCMDSKLCLVITRMGFASICGSFESVLGNLRDHDFEWLWNERKIEVMNSLGFKNACKKCTERHTWFTCI